MDLGVNSGKAAAVESWFDDLTEFDEKAEATTAGKITKLLVNIGVPGGVAFKSASGIAKTAMLAEQNGVDKEAIRLVCYQNALDAYGQSGQMKEEDWLNPPAIDQRTVFEGNSILRGQREPRVEQPKSKLNMDDLIIE